jgi:hypothetical protein
MSYSNTFLGCCLGVVVYFRSHPDCDKAALTHCLLAIHKFETGVALSVGDLESLLNHDLVKSVMGGTTPDVAVANEMYDGYISYTVMADLMAEETVDDLIAVFRALFGIEPGYEDINDIGKRETVTDYLKKLHDAAERMDAAAAVLEEAAGI